MAHGNGDLDAAAALAARGVELGRRLRSADLEAEALQTFGRVRVDQCQPADGLALLDEAMLLVLDGRLSPYSTGKVYCSLISACEQLSDHGRAAEWTAATTRWAERHPFAVFPGLCRVHHATALQWRGQWAEAEQEATRACEELSGINLHEVATAGRASAHYLVGNRADDLSATSSSSTAGTRRPTERTPMAAAYALAHLRTPRINDDVLDYLERIQSTLDPFDGRFLVHGADVEVKEGEWPGTLVVLQFPDLAAARAWYDSSAYQAILPLRVSNIEGDAIIVQGVEPDYDAAATAAMFRQAD